MPPPASPPSAGTRRASPRRCAACRGWAEGAEGGARGRAFRAEEEVREEAETRVDFEEVV